MNQLEAGDLIADLRRRLPLLVAFAIVGYALVIGLMVFLLERLVIGVIAGSEAHAIVGWGIAVGLALVGVLLSRPFSDGVRLVRRLDHILGEGDGEVARP